MRSPAWSDLLVNVESDFPSSYSLDSILSASEVERLKAIDSATTDFGGTIFAGLSAIGELLVRTAESGQLTQDLGMSTGWLIDSLANLAGKLADENVAANYKLNALARSVARP